MGLRCLLGHDFGEPELQREREEEGDEVVTTVKEVKTCARCGETQIVSENTEVTTMEQLADEAAASEAEGVDSAGGSDRGTDAGPAGTPGEAAAADGEEAVADADVAPRRGDADDGATGGEGVTLDEEPGAETDDAVILDDGPAADAEAGATDAEPATGDADSPAAPADRPNAAGDSEPDGASSPRDGDAAAGGEEPDAESDDGVILDEDDDAPDDRDRGAWPAVDEDDPDGDERTAWPDHGGEDEGFSAAVGEGGDAGVEFGGGLTPEAAEQGETETEAETEYVEAPEDGETAVFDTGGEGETGITRGESPELETMGDDGPTEYYCPECGMVRAADGSSMRAGDICPECKRGYVDERPR
ncbi:hypothetical protein [Halorubrum sp. SP9]|uniref:DUF7093 family protein n=1 Tax=Halorubrum sp. SP9 TaxID=1537267 RepID=UPI0010F93537|nr:hypothetical protein [Halorubrum sp. SP9]TKX70378.1 hypothetical protein EXE45_04545 [Halorubrum sp. SP9]